MASTKQGGPTKGRRKESKPKKKEADVDEIGTIFARIDLNHDGRISVDELMKAAQYIGFNPTRKEAKQMILDVNPSQKDYVNLKEFRRIFDQHQHKVDDEVEKLKEAFAVFDKDKSGTISKDEIKAVLRQCGEDFDEKELDDMLALVDENGDGDISIEEFAMVMCDKDDLG